MASFVDMLNQGLGGLNTPLGMLGMQLMANSGAQPGATGASRLGNSLVGVGQQQAQMQQMALQQQLRQQQAQELQLRSQGMQQEQQQRSTLADMIRQDPALAQKFGPLGSAVLQAQGDPAVAAQFAKIGQNSEMAKRPWTLDQPNPDGTRTFMKYDLNTGDYVPVSTYKAPTMMNAEANVAKTQQELAMAPDQLAIQQQRADATSDNAEVAQKRLMLEQEKAAKEQIASQFKQKFTRLEFKQQARGAITQLEDAATLADEIANDPALKSLYGPNGYVPPVAGTDAANLLVKIQRMQAIGGLTELVKLKQNGVALTPVSNTDLSTAQTSFANFDKMQSDESAVAEFKRASASLRKAQQEAQLRANEFDSLFDTPSAGTPESSGPAQISDDAGYDALPSGATFTAPDGTLRRKP